MMNISLLTSQPTVSPIYLEFSSRMQLIFFTRACINGFLTLTSSNFFHRYLRERERDTLYIFDLHWI